MECDECGTETPFRKLCDDCGCCPDCCECELGGTFDADEFGEEPEDEFERRTRG